MKRLVVCLTLVVALTAGFFAAGPAQAEDKPWSVEASIGWSSAYVWRGQVLDDESVFWPSASFSIYGLTLGVWGNLEMTDVNGEEGNFTEVDLWAEYSFDVGMVSIPVGIIYYYFPQLEGDAQDTAEVYTGVSFDVLLSPSLTIYYDFDEVEGFYITAGISHSFALPEMVKGVGTSLDLGASIGWGSDDYNEGYFGTSDAEFNDLTLSASLPISFADFWTLTPSIGYSYLLGSDIQDAVEDDSKFYGGVSLAFSF